MNTELRTQLVGLFREAGRAHHEAFAASGGDDPDWPIWYADYLQLIYCLMNANFEHQARSPESDWSEYYADQLIERCAPSETPAEDKLALYHFSGCPFCSMVRANIERLGVDVELRDIFEDARYRDELVEARGRATVPVLRITSPNGEERWVPESRDIVSYLEKIVV
jgi:glutaredoxin